MLNEIVFFLKQSATVWFGICRGAVRSIRYLKSENSSGTWRISTVTGSIKCCWAQDLPNPSELWIVWVWVFCFPRDHKSSLSKSSRACSHLSSSPLIYFTVPRGALKILEGQQYCLSLLEQQRFQGFISLLIKTTAFPYFFSNSLLHLTLTCILYFNWQIPWKNQTINVLIL